MLERLRQENQTLHRELAKIQQPPPQAFQALFVKALEEAQLRKWQAESSGLACKHPLITQINEEISRPHQAIATRRDEALAKLREAAIQNEKVGGGGPEVPAGAADQRNRLIRKLIQSKAEAIKITTTLETLSSESSETPSGRQAQQMRAFQYQQLRELRAQIEEIETQLQYNRMD